MKDTILLEKKDGIATVTFNRPEKRNAVSYHMWQDLHRMAVDLEHDVDVRVVVFTGAGHEAFSAGADIGDFDLYRSDSIKARIYAAAFDGATEAVEALSKPTISMIMGYCIGGGCEFSLATDLRIAAENAIFGIPVARLGILVGYHEMRRLLRLIGPGNASYILLTGRRIDARQALEMGLVDRLLPLEEIREFTYNLAHEIAQLAPLSHKGNKVIMKTVLKNPSLHGLSPEEEDLPFSNFDTQDYHEGRRAFLEKRTPRFRGT